MFKCVIAIALVASVQAAASAAPTGVVTILAGRAIVIRALSQFDAAEGMRLMPDDLLRTDKDTFLRVEYEDRTSLELGPETRLQLNHPAARKKSNRPALYLLEGWLKVSPVNTNTSGKAALASVGMDIVDMSGVMVIHADSRTRSLFAEDGTARCLDRSAHGSSPVALKQGEFVIAIEDQPLKLQPRPSADFTAALPSQYRDTLPSRYDRFKDRAVPPKNIEAFTYTEVEPWIDAEPSVRRQFVGLWRRKADNAAFRASLDHELMRHPEWDPVLHPEKYQPNPPPHAVPATGPSPTAAAAAAPDPTAPNAATPATPPKY